MYKINKSTNEVVKLEERLFKDLKIRERENLQEWIVKNPEMLGEDLLIIQKEFSGFNDTKERLDLLALDKEGDLVVIENKLDDTGRDVVWQSLKYVSYCSTLNNEQILRIFQLYLDRHQHGSNAKESILEFLDQSEEEEILLNSNDQRIILVANHYRKEVTSTVLWLLKHEVKIQCFRATPYSMGEDNFLQLEQIIPLPETAQFMIDAQLKEKEERTKSKARAVSDALLIEFWGQLKEDLKRHEITYLDPISAKPRSGLGFTKEGVQFNYCIGNKTIRVELYILNDPEKLLIKAIMNHKNEVEAAFGEALIWQVLEGKKGARVKCEVEVKKISRTDARFKEEENWDQWIEWFRIQMVRFYEAINPALIKALKELNKTQ